MLVHLFRKLVLFSCPCEGFTATWNPSGIFLLWRQSRRKSVWDSNLIRRVETFRRLRYIVSLSGVKFGLPRLALASSVLLVVESWRFLVASAPWCRVDVDAAGVTSPESSCSMSKSPANITESLVIGSPDSAIPVKSENRYMGDRRWQKSAAVAVW